MVNANTAIDEKDPFAKDKGSHYDQAGKLDKFSNYHNLINANALMRLCAL